MSACIFDLDGTLLDSMGVWAQIDEDFLKGRGLDIPSDYIDSLAALSFPEAAAYTIARFGLPDSVEGLLTEWNDMAAYAYGHTVPMKAGAHAYLMALKQRGVKLAIATSLPTALYVPALENHGISGLFDAICSTDEVGQSKARPDVYLCAARKLGAAPRACVVFEDILQAVCSAKAAGMTVYGVYDEASKAQWAQIQAAADGVLYDFVDAPLI